MKTGFMFMPLIAFASIACNSVPEVVEEEEPPPLDSVIQGTWEVLLRFKEMPSATMVSAMENHQMRWTINDSIVDIDRTFTGGFADIIERTWLIDSTGRLLTINPDIDTVFYSVEEFNQNKVVLRLTDNSQLNGLTLTRKE